MTEKQKQCLLRMNSKTSFDVWCGLVKSIYDLTKEQIKELKNDFTNYEQTQKNNILWQQDKETIKTIINNWCVAFRCYSLYIK